MGKSDFKKLYSIIKSELGPVVTCKTSYFCDKFDPSQNYAGVVVHSVNKKFQWVNEGKFCCSNETMMLKSLFD